MHQLARDALQFEATLGVRAHPRPRRVTRADDPPAVSRDKSVAHRRDRHARDGHAESVDHATAQDLPHGVGGEFDADTRRTGGHVRDLGAQEAGRVIACSA